MIDTANESVHPTPRRRLGAACLLGHRPRQRTSDTTGPEGRLSDKQRYASRTVRTGKREAQRVLNEMISEAERGLSVRTSATVGDLLEQWFDFAARDFSPKTVKETRGFMDRNLLPALGTVPLSKLKAGDLDRFYRKLSVDGGSRSGPLAPGTIRRIHGILRRALARD